jgi:hypothetical protein
LGDKSGGKFLTSRKIDLFSGGYTGFGESSRNLSEGQKSRKISRLHWAKKFRPTFFI